ncbi:MAG TPA: long-chain-fatty-acid--CoA ligase [Gammaproteobacteria bacterium]|nr:long-chain-fatty-acid--CoA ligase [Gammaproteobacteria bacterium]
MSTDKPWVKNYPEGTPDQLEFDPKTLVTLLDDAESEYPESPAFANFGKSITTKEVEIKSKQFAAYLQKDLGLKKGDRIALMMPNLLQYPVVIFGALRAGLIVVNVNPLYTSRELKHQLKDSGAKVIMIFENSAHVLDAVFSELEIEHVIVTKIGDFLGFPKGLFMNVAVKYLKKMVPPYKLPRVIKFKDTLTRSTEDFKAIPISVNDIAFLQYTSGTTGFSKGAMLSHGNVTKNLDQFESMLTNILEDQKDIYMNALPIYHIYSLVVCVFAGYSRGALNVLITNPRDTAAFIEEMKKWPFTFFNGVNTLYESLLNHPEIKNVNFDSMKLSGCGGMATLKSTAERWYELTGKVLLEGYGLSETSPGVTVSPAYTEKFTGTVGLPIPNTEISIRDDDGNEVERGQPGEICIKGPQVMQGYWRNEEATAEVIGEDGFFKTGDIGTMDDEGFLSIVDRKKDMIIVSGFNVYPNEIEDVVCMHPGIVEAASIGVTDEKTGEAVKLFVVLGGEQKLAKEEIIDYCRQNLAAYKVPKQIEFMDELPKTNVGKILRRELRE